MKRKRVRLGRAAIMARNGSSWPRRARASRGEGGERVCRVFAVESGWGAVLAVESGWAHWDEQRGATGGVCGAKAFGGIGGIGAFREAPEIMPFWAKNANATTVHKTQLDAV